MKVLMFGWEFPPHISGGLGTACHGLTHAMSAHGVEIIFVVPVLRGGEEGAGVQFIDGSEVVIPMPGKLPPVEQSGFEEVVRSEQVVRRNRVLRKEDSVTKQINIPTLLSPYVSDTSVPAAQSIRQWNYSINEALIFREEHITKRAFPAADVPTVVEGVKRKFTGTYGKSLLQEVDDYAVVAGLIARNNTFDIIHAHDWITFKAGLAAKEIAKKPLVLHVHSTEFDRAGLHGNPAVHELERDGMLAADHIIAVSEWTRNIIIERYKIPEDNVTVVHNGIEPKKRTLHFEHSFDGPVVTFLGRITYQKGPLFFVEAALKVLQKFPDTQFVVAGSGDLLPEMIERIASKQLSSHFHFTGFLKETNVDKIWAISDVYVMPSVSEPFGITPLEAIQAGVPVIISNQSGVSEVMPHAIKVNFWDTQALADAVCSVLQYKSLSNTLKENSQAEIEKITWSKAANKIKDLYEELTIESYPKKT
jgi:glycosyltransferase involved in cell wall biosynthesis